MRTRWVLATAISTSLALGAVVAQSGVVPGDSTAEQVAYSMKPPSAVSVPGTIDVSAVREAIEEANAKWLSAFRSDDAGSLARMYTPDASLFPPSNVSLEGRDRIVEYFTTQKKAGVGDASLKTLDVVCVGDVAYETGTYRFGVDDIEPTPGDTGRYFAIWKAQPDGAWRYHVGILSSNRDAVSSRH